jgi:hypothetical protein
MLLVHSDTERRRARRANRRHSSTSPLADSLELDEKQAQLCHFFHRPDQYRRDDVGAVLLGNPAVFALGVEGAHEFAARSPAPYHPALVAVADRAPQHPISRPAAPDRRYDQASLLACVQFHEQSAGFALRAGCERRDPARSRTTGVPARLPATGFNTNRRGARNRATAG